MTPEELDKHLLNNPDDAAAWAEMARYLLDGGKPHLARLCIREAMPEDPSAGQLCVRGVIELHLQNFREAEDWLSRAYKADPNSETTMMHLASLCMERGEIESGAKWADRTLTVNPENWAAKHTLAFARLHERDWGAGWDLYEHGLGRVRWRDRQDYGLPDWNGDPGASIVLYAEQALGEQIVWCSAVPDLAVVDLDVHPKLHHLMARSYPDIAVHGDQFNGQIGWKTRATHQCSMSQAMKHVRRTRESWVGRPYLVPCMERSLQWRATLEALGPRPKIGLAWTGGSAMSAGSRTRDVPLAAWRPLLDLPVDVISLEYRDKSEEIEAWNAEGGPQVHSYPRATVTDDLDDFAALIANLDAVVCVPTTAYHVAGALGVRAFVNVHSTPHWHEGLSGGCPYWSSVEYYRRAQLGDQGAIQEIAAEVRQLAGSE